MSEETEQFVVSEVEWRHVPSREQGTGRTPPAQLRDGPQQVFVTCRCGHAWRARRHGINGFTPAIGSIRLECPACETQGVVSNAALKDF